MNNKISSVISRLETQSKLEESGNVEVERQERMLAITKETGQFFNILLKIAKSRRIIEIGTSTGYSTLWFADALLENDPENVHIVTIEENTTKVKRALKNFQEAKVSKIIDIRNGKAKEILEKISEEIKNGKLRKFDFAFIDADKEGMIGYFEQLLPLIKKEGIIAADNILYPEKFRPLMRKYSKHVQNKKNVQSVTIPIGNGEEVSVKLSE